VLPPSRGRRKEGALAPSASADLRAAGASAFPTSGLLAGVSPARGFAGVAAVGFDPAVALVADALGPEDFNCFDGALCDVLGAAFPACLLFFLADVLAVARRFFEGADFADVFEGARAAFPEDALGDFLRVFLDIRLPFVAFGGSTMEGIAGLVPASRNRADCWASLMAPEYGYKEFDAPPVRSLNVLLGPDDE